MKTVPFPHIFLILLIYSVPHPTNAQSCTILTTSPSTVKLLQQNGTVDYLTTFTICPNPPTTTTPSITSSSSSQQVLPLDSIILSTIASTPCRNLTASFTFDALVGQTVYTLTASAEDYSCATSVTFTIVGITIYDTVPASSITSRTVVPADSDPNLVHIILSGDTNKIRTDYRDNLQTPTTAFNVKVQYPDGTDSTTHSTDFIINSLSTLTAVSETNAASPVRITPDACQIVQNDLEDSLDDPSCGAAFARQGDQLAFGMRYSPYRDGQTNFLFTWDFTTGDPDLAGETYELFLSVEVFGDPPPIITSVSPKKQFYRAGGEEITVVFDNVDGSIDRKLRAGDFEFPEVPGSFRKLPNGLYEAKYVTKPGRGTDLEWTVDVSKTSGEVSEAELIEDAEDETISFVDIPLAIDEIEPPFAVEGQTITLTGYFDLFDPTKPEHKIFIGNKPLSELGIIPNVSENSISFFVPSRGIVGAAFEFPITVVMNDEGAGNNDFAYVPEEPIEVTIEVYGASYNDKTEEYSLGECDVTDYEANLPSGLSDPEEFRWEMYQIGDTTLSNRLLAFPEISSKERHLRLPPKVFGDKTGAFAVFVACTVQNVTLNATVVVLKAQAPVIGVSLSRPKTRTLSTPNVAVRIEALVFPPDPDCFSLVDGQGIIFEWYYLEKKYVYSPSDTSDTLSADSPKSARLGRELVIPQTALQFGNLSVSLVTYVEGARSVQGTSVVTFSVIPSDMIPVIGFGSSRIMHSSARSLEITGERSFNPDEAVRSDIGVEIYEWGCRISTTIETSEIGEPCSLNFLPNSTEPAFTVSRDTLRRFRDQLQLSDGSEAGTFYLQYSLSVGSVFGMSDPAFQVIIVLPFENDVASLESVTVYDNRGNSLDWGRIPVSEDITIVPEGVGLTWKFDVVFPPSGKGIFNDSENLITIPDYFDPIFPFPLATALGIRADALEAAQQYEISIEVFADDDSVMPGEVRIRILTLDVPKLVLPELPLITGDLKTTFSATARVNLDNTYTFIYSFYLVTAEGEEYCLDGCSGRSTVQFRVVQTGTYRILVRLRDMQGTALLDEKFFSNSLTVTDSESRPSVDVSSLSNLLEDAYRVGDHGTVELLAAYLPTITRSRGANGFSTMELDVVRRVLDIMYQTVRNSYPGTVLSKSYTKTASRMASVISDYFSSEEIMYVLFSMVHTALLQVPQAESLDLEEELRAFYNFSARHVFRAFAGSTSRSLRQVANLPAFELGARSLLVDMFLLQQEHLTIALSRDAYCGSVRHVDTRIPGGLSAREIREIVKDARRARARRIRQESVDFVESYAQPDIPSFSSFTVGILCTPRQALGIRGEVSNFRWCDDASEAGFVAHGGVYRLDPGQKRLFTLAETMDFVAMSGLAEDNMQTDTSFLVTTNLTEVGSQGLKAFPFPEIEGCLALNTSMVRLGVTASRGCLSADAFVVNAFGSAFTSRDTVLRIQRNFSSISSVISRDRSSTILISSSRPGTFGAFGKDCPVNARKPVITPPALDVEFAYLVFGGAVVAVVGVTVTWVATSSSYVGSVATAAAAA